MWNGERQETDYRQLGVWIRGVAKAANPPLFYGSAGNGSQHHLAMELFKQRTGINLTHIPYTGGGAATATALLAGDISATIERNLLGILRVKLADAP